MIALDRLLASATGEVDDDEAEEHVLACDACARVFAAFARLGPEIAALVRSGEATMPATPALIERLDAAGLISRRYVLRPGDVVPCAIAARDLYSLTTYHADLAGVARVDMIRAGRRIADIPFDARGGRVQILTRASVLRALPTTRIPLALIAVDASGERTLASYVLDHAGFAPG